MNTSKPIIQLACGLLISVLAGAIHSQESYPSRPIRMIIPFAPGGSTDVVGRQVAQKLAAEIGGAVVSENKGGGGGVIGAAEVARARPDGYTLLFSASSTQVIAPAMMDKPPYDGIKDFTAISLVGLQYMSLVSGSGMPAQNARDFLAVVRANPGKYAFGSAGPGSINHLAGELFNRQAKVSIIHVPYKGMGPAMTDLMAGRLALVAATTASVLPQVRAGKARMLMTLSPSRLKSTPDVPTASEVGIPGADLSTFSGVFAPAATPKAVVSRLSQAMAKVMASEDLQKNLEKLGIEPVTDSSPESANQYIKGINERLLPIIKSLRASQS